MLRQPALSAIWAYQRYVSPRKGFGCAYRLTHGGTGCSGYAKAAIAEHGMIRATPLVLQRFAACKAAARHLLASQNNGQEAAQDHKTKRRWYDRCDGCGGCMPCGGGKGKSPDTGPDCTPDCSPDCCSL